MTKEECEIETSKAIMEMRKRIAELEKENAELKERNAELRGMYVHSAREAGTYKQFLELKEKENAELKKLKRECETSLCRAEYQYNYEQLTKAKELLERCYDNYIHLEPLRSEIEQFLHSEVEK